MVLHTNSVRFLIRYTANPTEAEGRSGISPLYEYSFLDRLLPSLPNECTILQLPSGLRSSVINNGNVNILPHLLGWNESGIAHAPSRERWIHGFVLNYFLFNTSGSQLARLFWPNEVRSSRLTSPQPIMAPVKLKIISLISTVRYV